jgi:hypothetical protein
MMTARGWAAVPGVIVGGDAWAAATYEKGPEKQEAAEPAESEASRAITAGSKVVSHGASSLGRPRSRPSDSVSHERNNKTLAAGTVAVTTWSMEIGPSPSPLRLSQCGVEGHEKGVRRCLDRAAGNTGVLVNLSNLTARKHVPEARVVRSVDDSTIFLTIAVAPKSWTRVTHVTETQSDGPVTVESPRSAHFLARDSRE